CRNPDRGAGGIRSVCRRLQRDLRERLKRGDGRCGAAGLAGSIGVGTVSMARLGHLCAGDEPALIRELDRLLEVGRETLERRRETVHELIDGGLYPYTRRYLGHLGNHFSTLGVNGMNEMVRNFTG